jgi:hypothetical protein
MNDPQATTQRMWTTRTLIQLTALLGALLLSSCAPGPNTGAGTGSDPAGFWPGLWHGIIAPVTFVISLFTDNVNIYEVNNNGNWYDFGFFLGLVTFLGGAGSRAKKRG